MRNHILNVAEGLFYREGIHAVGIDRVIAEAKIAKATLYSKFSSKHALVLAYLEARSSRILTNVHAAIDRHEGQSAEKLLFLFDQLETISQPESPFRGCAFMLALAENAGDPDVRAIALRHKSRFRGVFEQILAETYDDSHTLAEQAAIAYEGALTMLALSGTTENLPAAKACVRAILATAQVREDPG